MEPPAPPAPNPAPRRTRPGGFALVAASLAVGAAACASGVAPQVIDIRAPSRLCYDEARADRTARRRDWFSRWMDCQTRRVMPLMIEAYPFNETRIRDAFRHLNRMALKVDQGVYGPATVHAAWDDLLDFVSPRQDMVCNRMSEGGETCVSRTPSGVYFADRNGRLTPFVDAGPAR